MGGVTSMSAVCLQITLCVLGQIFVICNPHVLNHKYTVS